MCGHNRESLASPWLWGQPESVLAQWRCLQSNLSSCRDLLGVSTGLAFGPGLHCCQLGNLPLCTDSQGCVEWALQSLQVSPGRQRGISPAPKARSAAHGHQDWPQDELAISASPSSLHWDHVHPSANSLLPEPAPQHSCLLEPWGEGLLQA